MRKLFKKREAVDVEEALHTYGDMVYRLALVQMKNRSEAEDVFQEVFLRLIRYAADEETVLNEVSAATYIFMDDALCSGQYETFLEAVPDWLTENCQGVPAGIYLRMAESEGWQQIDRSNYEDKLREDIYTGEAECAISGRGKVTVY